MYSTQSPTIQLPDDGAAADLNFATPPIYMPLREMRGLAARLVIAVEPSVWKPASQSAVSSVEAVDVSIK